MVTASNSASNGSLLGTYRVLDLAQGPALLCGKILADLGADVIKIEPPGGDPTRRLGPFYHDEISPGKSLFWFPYNANKRGITLNIETADGQAVFKEMALKADLIIESFLPKHMRKLGLDYKSLSQVNQRLVMVSISPFGQTGPYSSYKATDLVAMAMSGFSYINGEPDRPPIRLGFPHAFFHAGVQAAVAAAGALYYRDLTGEGQYIDVSAQQAAFKTSFNAVPFWETSRTILKRAGNLRAGVGKNINPRLLWPCRDGFVIYTVRGGISHARANKSLVQWMDGGGMADEFVKTLDWDALDMGKIDQAFVERMEQPFNKFFEAHTMAELYQGGLERQVDIYPVSTQKALQENEQLKFRQFWTGLEHPELNDTLTYPGTFVRSTECACDLKRRAPLIGEHNREVYGEHGFSAADIITLKGAGAI
ncbi:MAG: CoA transferase [Dehalococcoidales bacterium]|nr:CoA transferase [Dehalococcoidales bacterium]